MSEMISATEQIKAWRERLTEDEKQRVSDFMARHGWKSGDWPPAYVWLASLNEIAPAKNPLAALSDA